MKTLRAISVVLAAIVLVVLVPASTGAQGGVWNSGFQVVNMDPVTDATVGITFYREDGSIALEVSGETIPAGESKTYYLPTVSGLADGQYSVVVSASTEVAAVTNLTNYGANMADSYPGFSTGASEASLPLIMRTSNWKSHISIQATQDAEVYIEFYAAGNPTPVLRYPSSGTISILTGATKTYDVSAAAFSGLGSSYVGSAKVHASSGEAVAMVQEFRTVGYSLVSILPGSTTSGTKLLAPLVYNDFQKASFPLGLAWRTGIQVQNVGSSSTDVRVTINGTNVSGSWSVVKSIAPNSSETFYLPSESAIPTDMYGSAVIESGVNATPAEPIVAIINTTKYGTDVGMAYNAFVDGSATSKVSAPLVYGTFQQGVFGPGQEWRSGVQVMNVDSSATDTYIKVTFTNANASLSGGPWTTTAGPVSPGDSHTFYLPSVAALPIEFYGSAEIEAVDAGGTPIDVDIVAIVNTTKYSGHFATCYPGINHN